LNSAIGIVALHEAEIMSLLLNKESLVDDMTRDEWTPFHRASCSGQLDAVKLLLEHCAAIDHQSADGSHSTRPLYYYLKKAPII